MTALASRLSLDSAGSNTGLAKAATEKAGSARLVRVTAVKFPAPEPACAPTPPASLAGIPRSKQPGVGYFLGVGGLGFSEASGRGAD